jgi:hypothetical protein
VTAVLPTNKGNAIAYKLTLREPKREELLECSLCTAEQDAKWVAVCVVGRGRSPSASGNSQQVQHLKSE